jgi:hypothetical protein
VPKKKGHFGFAKEERTFRIEDTKTQIKIYFKFRIPHSAFYNEKTPPPLPESGVFSYCRLTSPVACSYLPFPNT